MIILSTHALHNRPRAGRASGVASRSRPARALAERGPEFARQSDRRGCDRGPEPAADPPDPGLSTDATSTPVRDTVLEAALRDAAAQIQGHIGVAALHLQSGVRASVNGDRRFLLASVYKLSIAYAALQGDADPADSVAVTPTDRAPGETPFAPGMAVPLAGLVERSLVGGPDEVNRRIQALGVHDVRVDRSMARVSPGPGVATC